jgi:RimJ/RimL family protein N-acetyltransferase
MEKSSLPAFDSQFSILNSHFIPASSLSIEQLADLYTRMFGEYFYPALVTPAELAERIPAERLLLDRSPVLCVDETPAGMALLGLRGERSCCGGFGIVPGQRGRGLALPLTLALLDQARQCGARRMTLIVLAQNQRAIATYQRAGFTIWREIRSFEWAREAGAPGPAGGELVPAAVADLLALGPGWQPVAPIWSRDAATLGALKGLEGLALIRQGAMVAYLLLRRAAAGAADILSLGARTFADAADALAALQRQSDRITCHCEPADSPAALAMDALGFARTFRRYEMHIRL